MSIINSKERAFRPFLTFSILRFNYIKNDWYSILIIIPHQSLMCVCWISSHESISLYTLFRCIKFQSINFTCWNNWLGFYNSFISLKSEKIRVGFLIKSWKLCDDCSPRFGWLRPFISVFVWNFNVGIIFRNFYLHRTILLSLEYFEHFLRLSCVCWKLKLLWIFCFRCLRIVSWEAFIFKFKRINLRSWSWNFNINLTLLIKLRSWSFHFRRIPFIRKSISWITCLFLPRSIHNWFVWLVRLDDPLFLNQCLSLCLRRISFPN